MPFKPMWHTSQKRQFKKFGNRGIHETEFGNRIQDKQRPRRERTVFAVQGEKNSLEKR